MPSGAVTAGTPATVTVTINDDDVPAVSFAAATADAGEGDGTVEVTVQLSTSPATAITIPVMTADGTGSAAATAGEDYTALTTDVVFAAATATLTQTVSITITDDDRGEPAQTFTVAFGTLPADVVTAGTPAAVTVTITDDDIPTVSFATATASVSEDAGTVEVMVQLSSSPADDITIPVMTIDGTAEAPGDYTALTQDVVFAAATTTLTQTISVTVADDDLVEADQTFTVAFGTLPSGVAPGTRPTVTVTIESEDTATLTVDMATVSGAETAGPFTIQALLSSPVEQATTISLEETAGSTATVTDDFMFPASVTFAANSMSADIEVTYVDDNVVEDDEMFGITFSTPLPADITSGAQSTVNFTITSADTATVAFVRDTVNRPEVAGTFDVRVILSNPLGQATTFPLEETVGSTATEGTDFEFEDSVTFAAGSSAATFEVTYIGDNVVETNEMFALTFTAPLPADITLGVPPTIAFTIVNDDTTAVSFSTPAIGISEGNIIGFVYLELTNPASLDLTIPIALVPGTAMAGTHYEDLSSLVISAGDTRGEIRINTIDDNVDNANRTFMITVGTPLPTDVTLGALTTVAVVINDND